jgi:hypothetical protein
MNQEKLQNIFIGLLIAGLMGVGAGVYFIGNQMKAIEVTVNDIQGLMIQQGTLQQQPGALQPQGAMPINAPGTTPPTPKGVPNGY